ncbi:CHAP domain-containing protein [Bifidobacterium aemilianum]|uniref:CHAP domain-containing protein n=1 Tax=Bifidobacterium aemilianum TaxID=2493120 RepID=A0A366K9N5_9BIFI|nr:CHAP domain-containing protein [Bifidobacterium aemilianum]RBP98309.1 CHAP domain-containing protein [Bifidobacterium aemilianum]
MKQIKRLNAVASLIVASATLVAFGAAGMTVKLPQAQAVSWYEYQQTVQNNENLKAQLSGVSDDLANQIIQLDDLTSNQIPAAEKAQQDSQQKAEQAKSLAKATGERLDAAKKDKADLEAKIKQSGEDFDDAKEGMAQMARKSFHGSEASAIMDVVTKASTTEDFVNKMQADASVARSESNLAKDSAGDLNVSMNRRERLAAIENRISALKKQADDQDAAAQRAVEDASAKQLQLQSLRDQGNATKASLEQQKSSLTSRSAKEAADIVAMKAEIDLAAQQQAAQAAAAADPSAGGQQAVSGPVSGDAAVPGGGAGVSGMDYGVPGSCPPGAGFCYGHPTGNSGNAYPGGQCTAWAYVRRSQLGLPVGSYFGNARNWAGSARSFGYLVNNSPHVGAVVVFGPGQAGADSYYGHVAVVERVNADGSILISEGNAGHGFGSSRIVYNAYAYQYIHY